MKALNRVRRACLFTLATLAASAAPAHAANTGRIAILCAYEPEWRALLPSIGDQHEKIIAGTRFVEGMIDRTPVVLVETGVSMVNATMAAQLALDNYKIDDLLVAGIAGGVDPSLRIGDVIVPAQWSQYLESIFARDGGGGTYTLPGFASQTTTHYGMIFPQPVELGRAPEMPAPTTWFAADPGLLKIAGDVAATTTLAACGGTSPCVKPVPRVVVGGNGVSGQSFVDNAAFRTFAHQAFAARALDMESAAVAQVAAANHVPFVAFRSLSDLAGGDADANAMKTYEALAARNVATVIEAFVAKLR